MMSQELAKSSHLITSFNPHNIKGRNYDPHLGKRKDGSEKMVN